MEGEEGPGVAAYPDKYLYSFSAPVREKERDSERKRPLFIVNQTGEALKRN